ncbi:hypothetical protein LIER_35759 [Lithospermum erythrorhizon]|uniref:GAG-pre-integrase domain-containing protein n=1 Tax=Lithospermum erythrorhizon TaxID=34254 RepID=A0AAV3P0M8_LITER
MSLISSGKLDDEGMHNVFGNGHWKLLNKSKLIAKGAKNGTLYKWMFRILENDICTVSTGIDVWHKRLCHMIVKGLAILAKRNLIPTFDEKMMPRCDHCMMGKKHRQPFNKSSCRKENNLDLIYSDVCGPMKV